MCVRERGRGWGRPVEMLLQNSTALQIAPIHGIRAHSEGLCAQVRTHRERLQAFSVARRCAQGGADWTRAPANRSPQVPASWITEGRAACLQRRAGKTCSLQINGSLCALICGFSEGKQSAGGGRELVVCSSAGLGVFHKGQRPVRRNRRREKCHGPRTEFQPVQFNALLIYEA